MVVGETHLSASYTLRESIAQLDREGCHRYLRRARVFIRFQKDSMEGRGGGGVRRGFGFSFGGRRHFRCVCATCGGYPRLLFCVRCTGTKTSVSLCAFVTGNKMKRRAVLVFVALAFFPAVVPT